MTNRRKTAAFTSITAALVLCGCRVGPAYHVPAATPIAEAMSKDLRKRGFNFCGPTIVYAFMQACGLVNDHLMGCHRHDQVAALNKRR